MSAKLNSVNCINYDLYIYMYMNMHDLDKEFWIYIVTLFELFPYQYVSQFFHEGFKIIFHYSHLPFHSPLFPFPFPRVLLSHFSLPSTFPVSKYSQNSYFPIPFSRYKPFLNEVLGPHLLSSHRRCSTPDTAWTARRRSSSRCRTARPWCSSSRCSSCPARESIIGEREI